MTAQKKRPRVGETKWEVEWCSKLAFYEDSTDTDMDRCTMSFRYFATEAEAVAFAAKTWPETVKTFGVVEICEVRFTAYDDDDAAEFPHVGFWEHIGTVQYITDESGKPE